MSSGRLWNKEQGVLQPVIITERIGYLYHPGTPLEKKALEEVSLQIEEGECIGIVGETGSGKTTLVQHFNGLLRPSSGKIWVEGVEIGRPGTSWVKLRQRVGLVFQYPEHQLFEETVFDDISFVLRQGKIFSAAEVERRVKSACAVVGLDYEDFRGRSPLELSSGEMRRAALAGILVQEPSLLILDEPTVGLDGPGKREILREIRHLHRSGKTVVIVSHEVEDLLEIVNRLIVLDQGNVLITGSPPEVFSFLLEKDQLTFLVPPVYRLCSDLRAAGWDIPAGIYRVEETIPVLDRMIRNNPVGTRGILKEN